MSKNEEYPRHWRCKVCGQSSPVTAYKCNNPQCGADLLVSGEIIFEETAPPPPPPPPFDWEEVETEPEKKKPKQKKPKKEKVKREKPKKEKVQREKKPKEAKSGKGWLIGLAAVLAIALLGALLLPILGDSGNDTQLREPEIPTTTQTQPVDTAPVDTAPPATEPLWNDNILMQDLYSDPFYIVLSEDDFIDTVLGSQILRRDIRSITFLDTLNAAPEGSWDVSEKQDGSVLAWAIVDGDYYNLYIAGEGGVNASKACDGLFGGYINVKNINFNGCFHTEGAESMENMFDDCKSLEYLNLSCFDTSSVTSMNHMFSKCGAPSLNLSSFCTSNVTDMNGMFDGADCDTLNLSHFDTSKVTDMSAMFAGINCITLDLSNFDTSKVTDMSDMFERAHCSTLDLSNFDTSKVTDMNCMFNGCRKLNTLDISNFDTANVTDMGAMFANCGELRSLDISSFDTSNVTGMGSMFRGMTHITLDVSHFNTSKVTRMSHMFDDRAYGGLNVIGWENFDTSNVTEYEEFFCWNRDDSWKNIFPKQ